MIKDHHQLYNLKLTEFIQKNETARRGGEAINNTSSRALKIYDALAISIITTHCIHHHTSLSWGKHRIYVHNENYNMMMLFQLSQWKKQETIFFFLFCINSISFYIFRLWYSLFLVSMLPDFYHNKYMEFVLWHKRNVNCKRFFLFFFWRINGLGYLFSI